MENTMAAQARPFAIVTGAQRHRTRATETEFFERADMLDTKVGTEKKMEASEVARIGFDALSRGRRRGRALEQQAPRGDLARAAQ
jgi:hypothetical protein